MGVGTEQGPPGAASLGQGGSGVHCSTAQHSAARSVLTLPIKSLRGGAYSVPLLHPGCTAA